MKYLVGAVAFLAVVSFEAVLFLGGAKYGFDAAYRVGYDAALQEERDARLSFILDRMAFYESSYNVNARGDCDAGRCLAFGLYQFHHPTFNHLAHLAGCTNLSWKNPEHQHRVAKWAIQHGYGKLWGQTYHHALHDYFMKMVKE